MRLDRRLMVEIRFPLEAFQRSFQFQVATQLIARLYKSLTFSLYPLAVFCLFLAHEHYYSYTPSSES